jgi:carbon monoxide dehydrogenase subunit G
MDYAGRFDFPVAPNELWDALQRLDQFERWWGWLGNLRIDGDGLEAGAVLHGTVAPPVPYRMRVDVELLRCVPGRLIDASVTGDLRGDARLRLQPGGEGTIADVAWSLEMLQRPMRLAARVAHPLLRWGHDCVVEATVRGFRSQLRPRPA